MKKRFLFSILFSLILLITALPARAQGGEELILRLSKTMGFAAGGQVQGTFGLSITGPEDLARVVFYLDEQVLGEATQAPFGLSFSTDSYPLGEHTLQAVGYKADGKELRSNPITVTFVSAEAGWQYTLRLMAPLFVVIAGVALLSILFPIIMNRGKNLELAPGTPRKYGMTGGAVCPRCQRPFAMHAFSPNLTPVHRYDRCPYCGKWALMRRRSMDELRRAEAAELERAAEKGQVVGLSEEEKLRKELENSRYRDL